MATDQKGDLSVTALYTSATWSWGKLPCAELLATREARVVFGVVNLALAFMRLFRWSLRSLRHSLMHRHTMIDHLLTEAKPELVLELASGLSRRGAAFSADASLEYVEVDLPSVVEHKRMLLGRTEAGQSVLARSNLAIQSADVAEDELTPFVTSKGRLFVIAEGLLMYLKADAQQRLFEKIAQLCRQADGATFVFDWVPAGEQPRPGPIGRVLEWIMKRFTGGRSFEQDPRTREEMRNTLLACGFQVSFVEPATVAEAWNLPYPGVKTQQLLFVCKWV
jgi:O-methyltransferase involved in polyketide biosynthesis